MKLKKSKKVKKVIKFFRIHFDFHYPYKILLDGNFIAVCKSRDINIKQFLQKYFSGQIWIQVTSCVINELNQLGEQFRETLEVARSLPRLKCGHIIGISPKECFQSLIGKKNESQYLLCTQDQQLRQDFSEICMPLLFLSVDFLLDIEEPKKVFLQKIQNKEELKYLPNKIEQKEILIQKKQEKFQEKEKQRKKVKQEIDQFGILIKKRASAPNPLSVKRKVLRNQRQNQQEQSQMGKQKRKQRYKVRSKKLIKQELKQQQQTELSEQMNQ